MSYSEENEKNNVNRNIIFDTDPGNDDAIALFLLSKFSVKPSIIFTTYGNTSLNNTTRNAKLLNKYLNINAKIARGASCSLSGEHAEGSDYHGTDGLGETAKDLMKLFDYEESKDELTINDVKDYILNNNHITYIAIGPLTNLATLINMDSRIKDHIDNVYIMGGGIYKFDWKYDSEFNFFTDPKAVEIVLESGLNITMFPCDITQKYPVLESLITKLKDTKKYEYLVRMMGRIYHQSTTVNGAIGAYIYDPFLALYVANPEKFELIDMKLISNEYGHIEQSENGHLVHVAMSLKDKDLFINKLLEGFKS